MLHIHRYIIEYASQDIAYLSQEFEYTSHDITYTALVRYRIYITSFSIKTTFYNP